MTITLKKIYKLFPNTEKCIEFLEDAIWNNNPKCPYCGSHAFTKIENGKRYHCKSCKTSFSVTVGTLFHRTRCDLQKWFLAILLKHEDRNITSRLLAEKLEVTKDTAWLMSNKIDVQKNELDNILLKLIKATNEK